MRAYFYHLLLAILLGSLILLIATNYAPESPYYLHQKRDFKNLKSCFNSISKLNLRSQHSEEQIDTVVDELIASNIQFNLINGGP
jgi:hypothetical protein